MSARMSETLMHRSGTTARNAEILRRVGAGETMVGVACEFGISRQRVEQIVRRANNTARKTLGDAVAAGRIVRPAACEECGIRTERIEAHHDDYTAALTVRWLCCRCHGVADRVARERATRAALGLAKNDTVVTAGEAACLARTTNGVVTEAIRNGELVAHRIGHFTYLSRSAVLAWTPVVEEQRRKVRAERKKTHCKHGHPLDPWNVRPTANGGRQCLACVAINVGRRLGCHPQTTQFEVRQALVRCGFTIQSNRAGNIVAEGYGERITLTRGHGKPWRLVGGTGMVCGTAATAADVERLVVNFVPQAA